MQLNAGWCEELRLANNQLQDKHEDLLTSFTGCMKSGSNSQRNYLFCEYTVHTESSVMKVTEEVQIDLLKLKLSKQELKLAKQNLNTNVNKTVA